MKPIDPKDIATKFTNRVFIRSFYKREPTKWCFENVANKYEFEIVEFVNQNGRMSKIYSFAKKEDAVAFKLRWV